MASQDRNQAFLWKVPRYTTLLRAVELWGAVQADGLGRSAGDEELPPVDGLVGTASVCGLSWLDGVVPVAVKRGGRKVRVAISASDTLDALRVGAAVEAALDGEAGAGGGAGDQLDDHLVGEQGLAAPVLGDEGEQPMLDPVPPDAVIRAQALTQREACRCGRGERCGCPRD